MVKKSDFNAVFAAPKRHANRYFTFLVHRKSEQSCARLGLAVSKKVARSAVERNRIKRQIRESFRRQPLCQIDVVVIAKPPSARATNAELNTALVRLWLALGEHYGDSLSLR